MAFYEISVNLASLSPKKLIVFALIFVFAFAPRCHGHAVPFEGAPESAPQLVSLGSVITETREEVRRYVESVVGAHVIETSVENAVMYLESVFGPDNVYAVTMFVEMLLRFVAEGAASGLNVIAVYVFEILRVTGFDAKLPFPHFTPEGVAAVAKWALLALIGYWVLSIVLRVAVALLRRVFWLLKAGVAMWLFVLIVSDASVATDTTTTLRLAGLVLACALIGIATGNGAGKESAGLENRLSSLEGRINVMEKKKGEE